MEQRVADHPDTSLPRQLTLDSKIQTPALPAGSLEGYMASPEAQEAFTLGGERGYLQFLEHHGGLEQVLTNETARQVFASKGEAGYLDHIRRERARLFGVDTSSSVVTTTKIPNRTTTVGNHIAAPASVRSLAVSAGPIGTQPPKVPQDVQQPTVPPREHAPVRDTVFNPDAERAHNALLVAVERYAQVAARQRATHGEALLGGNRGKRLAMQVLSPIVYAQARRDHAEAQDARNAYRTRLNEYVEAVGGNAADKIQTKLENIAFFERRVLDLQIAQTRSARNARGNRQESRLDALRVRIARTWLGTSRAGRAMIVAGPAAVVGIGIGAATASAPGIVIAGAGLAAVFAGRSIGGAIASNVNRYAVATPRGFDSLVNASEGRRVAFAGQFSALRQAQNAIDPVKIDVTEVYEDGTAQVVRANARRSGIAQMLGAAAAAAGFGLSNIVTDGMRLSQSMAPQPTATHSPQPTATTPHPPKPPTPTTTPGPTSSISPNQYPWDVAHQMKQGNELNVIKQAAHAYNAKYGASMRLVGHGKYLWLQNGARALNAAQQSQFNKFMLQLFGVAN